MQQHLASGVQHTAGAMGKDGQNVQTDVGLEPHQVLHELRLLLAVVTVLQDGHDQRWTGQGGVGGQVSWREYRCREKGRNRSGWCVTVKAGQLVIKKGGWAEHSSKTSQNMALSQYKSRRVLQ